MTKRVVVAFDKFRGSATAAEVTDAGVAAARRAGWSASGRPMADGGEGSLEILGGPNRESTVTNPLGDPVVAPWRLDGRTAWIEMAAASGLSLIGGPEANDPIAADTYGTGELITQAVELGARTIHVLLGGSATTDGGFGAVRALPPAVRMKEIELIAACDVTTRFVDAAAVFGPQKGARPPQVAFLTRRLERLVQIYAETYGVDVSEIPGSGAAGGLAGGLVAVGGRIESGFEILAEAAELDTALEGADLVVTGEGLLDRESFGSKVVGGVTSWAADEGVPVLVVVGQSDPDLTVPNGVEVVSLTERFGRAASWDHTLACVEQAVTDALG